MVAATVAADTRAGAPTNSGTDVDRAWLPTEADGGAISVRIALRRSSPMIATESAIRRIARAECRGGLWDSI